VSDPAYNPDRFISDTATGEVDQYRCPVPPAEWGPGSMVRLVSHRGWQWVAPPPPRHRWEPMQPPATDDRPILITARIRREVDTSGPRDAGGHMVEAFSVTFANCDVAAWDEPRDKERLGELIMYRSQAEYLRDALTAMLERKP
jgi:hypothetical protein